ncbi:MAG: 3-dehydroquinate synthase [Candidatus Omnitrophica bacterium]|nr:3-dehydroquinate synthase [Candidatus Omnitrophota bacterium]
MKKHMYDINVLLKKRSYSIKIGYGIIGDAGRLLSQMDIGSFGIVITNAKVKRLYGKSLQTTLSQNGIETYFLTVPDSESSKSCRILIEILDKTAKLDKGKKPFIIAFGGGVIGDLAGFVAAIYRRGVPLVQIPTTLVAQVDSSIGGKVAIDLPQAKNLVGAFYQPKIVITDISLLKTLPKREVKCGISEIIKYSIIYDKKFFAFLNANMTRLRKLERGVLGHAIETCCKIKSKIVSMDEKDTRGIRAVLNYGHTIGHGIEAAGHYSRSYSHGEAVAIGMIGAAYLAVSLEMLRPSAMTQIRDLIKKAGLPLKVKNIREDKIFQALCHDKKFSRGINRFILPTEIGRVRVVKNISANHIKTAIRKICSR